MTLDSREVRPGALFCCVPGHTLDGHDLWHRQVKRPLAEQGNRARVDRGLREVVAVQRVAGYATEQRSRPYLPRVERHARNLRPAGVADDPRHLDASAGQVGRGNQFVEAHGRLRESRAATSRSVRLRSVAEVVRPTCWGRMVPV